MMIRIYVAFLLAVLLMSIVSGAKKDKKDKRRKKQPASNDLDEALEMLTERVEELEKKLGSAAGNNVHFFFHGDDGHHDHMHGEDDQHVHVDVHVGHDPHHHSHEDHFHHEHVAICKMSGSGIEGSVEIIQADNDRSAAFKIEFDHLGEKETEHKIHVHQFGDLSDMCNKIGGHYNPYHEGIDVGDLGTLLTDENGAVKLTWKNDTHLTLFGEYSIVGRSIMVHGADGSGMSCCAIGWSPETHDHGMDHSHVDAHSAHDHDHTGHSHDHTGHDHDHTGHDHDHHHH